jgi:ATP-dependent protease HslVU (ClpYQ) peptidase subunit
MKVLLLAALFASGVNFGAFAGEVIETSGDWRVERYDDSCELKALVGGATVAFVGSHEGEVLAISRDTWNVPEGKPLTVRFDRGSYPLMVKMTSANKTTLVSKDTVEANSFFLLPAEVLTVIFEGTEAPWTSI